jgi:hypothetical protein
VLLREKFKTTWQQVEKYLKERSGEANGKLERRERRDR